MWDFSFLIENKDRFIDSFFVTLYVSFFALLFSLILGIIIALFRVSTSAILRFIGTCYVEFFRNIPLLIIVYFFYFGPGLLGFTGLGKSWVGALSLAIYTSSYIAEVIRSGINTVEKGQYEAARSCGFNYSQTMRRIILPQAFRYMLPSLANQVINLVKNSSVLAIIAGRELVYLADDLTAEDPVAPVFFVIGMLYLVITLPLSFSVYYLEKHWGKKSKR